jgi:hypothetical protein
MGIGRGPRGGPGGNVGVEGDAGEHIEGVGVVELWGSCRLEEGGEVNGEREHTMYRVVILRRIVLYA